MRRAAALAAPLALAGLLPGCVAAALPVAAGAVIGGGEIARRRERPAEAFPAATATASATAGVTVTPLRALPPPSGSPSSAPIARVAASAVEAAAQSFQVFIALRNHMAASARLRQLEVEPEPVLLTLPSTAEEPEFYACQGKPLAVVFDVDGAVLASGDAVPGAREAVEAAREAGIAVVFSADRPAAEASTTRAALSRAGLGDAEPGVTLRLRDEGDPPGRDAGRLEIAKRYCAIAQVGNDLSDFSDLFSRRSDAAVSPQIAALWGAGWFVLPSFPPTTTGPVARVEEKR